MKTHWSVEKNGDIILRVSDNAMPLGVVGPVQPSTKLYEKGARGFTAIILKPGFPSAGPYRTRLQAAEWLQAWVKRHWFDAAMFSDVPLLGPREIGRAKKKTTGEARASA